MRNRSTTGRGRFVVAVLLLIAVFALHPACPPEPAHHGAFVPGISGELCHHGDTHHASPSAPAQAAVQVSALPFTAPDAEPAVRTVTRTRSGVPSADHGNSGRSLLLDLGISRT
ncbi:hypothetical protein JNUCC0626_02145 [Lentzea sp. JNUCC 0626]|uniref:hypothetical protein n=1 Tax=Lentzea sp. JNUCC 0626 TaxID=3367513 RepID=UPI0037494D73